MALLQGDQIGLFGDTEPVANKLERVENDYYPTPEAITKALLDVADIKGLVFEPCAGNSAISRVLREDSRIIQVIETDLTWGKGSRVPRDATLCDFWQYWTEDFELYPDWVVTNPPFNQAAQILHRSWENSIDGCAFLLRLSFLEPTRERSEMLKNKADFLRYIIPVSPRPKFRRDTAGSDSVTCAWFVWDRRWSWQEKGMQSPFQFLSGWRQS